MSDRATDRPDGSEYGPVLSSDVSVSLDDQYSNYVSIRINYPHADSANLRRTLSQYVEEFIYFPHLGKTKENPHYHICIPVKVGDDMIKCVDKYRKYFKMHLKLVGNKHMMCKSMDNGVAKFISYAAREGTTPVSKGDNWAYFIDKAPAWVEPVQQVLFQPLPSLLVLLCQ